MLKNGKSRIEYSIGQLKYKRGKRNLFELQVYRNTLQSQADC